MQGQTVVTHFLMSPSGSLARQHQSLESKSELSGLTDRDSMGATSSRRQARGISGGLIDG